MNIVKKAVLLGSVAAGMLTVGVNAQTIYETQISVDVSNSVQVEEVAPLNLGVWGGTFNNGPTVGNTATVVISAADGSVVTNTAGTNAFLQQISAASEGHYRVTGVAQDTELEIKFFQAGTTTDVSGAAPVDLEADSGSNGYKFEVTGFTTQPKVSGGTGAATDLTPDENGVYEFGVGATFKTATPTNIPALGGADQAATIPTANYTGSYVLQVAYKA